MPFPNVQMVTSGHQLPPGADAAAENLAETTLLDATVQTFLATVPTFTPKRIQMVHLVGSGRAEGFTLSGDQILPSSDLVQALQSQCLLLDYENPVRTLECVFLDGDNMQGIGHDLHKAGVPFVIYWKGRVDQGLMDEFRRHFYNTLQGMSSNPFAKRPTYADGQVQGTATEWGSVILTSWLSTKHSPAVLRAVLPILEGTLCMRWHPKRLEELDPQFSLMVQSSTQTFEWKLAPHDRWSRCYRLSDLQDAVKCICRILSICFSLLCSDWLAPLLTLLAVLRFVPVEWLCGSFAKSVDIYSHGVAQAVPFLGSTWSSGCRADLQDHFGEWTTMRKLLLVVFMVCCLLWRLHSRSDSGQLQDMCDQLWRVCTYNYYLLLLQMVFMAMMVVAVSAAYVGVKDSMGACALYPPSPNDILHGIGLEVLAALNRAAAVSQICRGGAMALTARVTNYEVLRFSFRHFVELMSVMFYTASSFIDSALADIYKHGPNFPVFGVSLGFWSLPRNFEQHERLLYSVCSTLAPSIQGVDFWARHSSECRSLVEQKVEGFVAFVKGLLCFTCLLALIFHHSFRHELLSIFRNAKSSLKSCIDDTLPEWASHVIKSMPSYIARSLFALCAMSLLASMATDLLIFLRDSYQLLSDKT